MRKTARVESNERVSDDHAHHAGVARPPDGPALGCPDGKRRGRPVPGGARLPARVPHLRLRPGAAAAARPGLRLVDLARRHPDPVRALHGHRARPAGSRRVRQARRRLLARRLRQRHARPADGARHRQGDGRRPQLRRWRRDAVRLSVPRPHRTGRPGVDRWPRQGGHSAHPVPHRAGQQRRDRCGDVPAVAVPGRRQHAGAVPYSSERDSRPRRGRPHLRVAGRPGNP